MSFLQFDNFGERRACGDRGAGGGRGAGDGGTPGEIEVGRYQRCGAEGGGRPEEDAEGRRGEGCGNEGERAKDARSARGGNVRRGRSGRGGDEINGGDSLGAHLDCHSEEGAARRGIPHERLSGRSVGQRVGAIPRGACPERTRVAGNDNEAKQPEREKE
ncbi:MAG: hypothetical protein D6679_12990 [Candidatus Hydrogenedentota bacterium]|nr:MAG: hypothetical protein D6679_12990 [Candidatus Hydrogenedentota bacterium]